MLHPATASRPSDHNDGRLLKRDKVLVLNVFCALAVAQFRSSSIIMQHQHAHDRSAMQTQLLQQVGEARQGAVASACCSESGVMWWHCDAGTVMLASTLVALSRIDAHDRTHHHTPLREHSHTSQSVLFSYSGVFHLPEWLFGKSLGRCRVPVVTHCTK